MADQDRINELRVAVLQTIMAAARAHHSSTSTSGKVLLAVGKLAMAAQLDGALFDEAHVKALKDELEALATS
ncbi:MAG TPA: hypothetical protein VII01_05185 [Solirubrobacteraceae bacterium]